jgi:hypothetical protein
MLKTPQLLKHLYVFIDSEINFTCFIILTNFRLHKNVVNTLTAKTFNILEIVLSGRKRPQRQFFSRNNFAVLIYLQITEITIIELRPGLFTVK